MTKDNLSIKSLETLKEDLLSSQTSYNELVYNHSVAPLENSHIIKNARRNIARILTELRKRELALPDSNLNRDKIINRRKRK